MSRWLLLDPMTSKIIDVTKYVIGRLVANSQSRPMKIIHIFHKSTETGFDRFFCIAIRMRTRMLRRVQCIEYKY